MKDKSTLESVVRESVAIAKALSPNPRSRTALGVDNIGLGRLLFLDFRKYG
jgi:hypothetical protein